MNSCFSLNLGYRKKQINTSPRRRIGLYSASLHLAFQFGDSLRTFVKTGVKSKIAGGQRKTWDKFLVFSRRKSLQVTTYSCISQTLMSSFHITVRLARQIQAGLRTVKPRQQPPEGGQIPYETSFVLFLNPNQELSSPALIKKPQAGCKLMLNCVGVTWCPTSGGMPPVCDLPWYHPNRPTIPDTRSAPDQKVYPEDIAQQLPLSLTTRQ